MKPARSRIVIVFGLLAPLALLLVVWLFRPQRKSPQHNAETAGPATVTETKGEPARKAPVSTGVVPGGLQPSSPTTNQAAIEEAKATQLQAAAAAKNVPVDFWGKVVDQDGQPLSGVRVIMRVRQWFYDPNGGPGTLSPKREATTDAGGNFEWTGANGDSLELESVTKEGYRLSPKAQTGFVYGRDADSFQPAAANPVVISMWKLMPSENLVSFRTLFGFVPDGRGYTMDLLANKKFEGEKPEGDMMVKLTRPAKVEPRQKYDWLLELDGVNGGLIEAPDEFGYMAPESGYQPKVSIRLKASDADWTDNLTKDFFIRSRGGTVYGLLHLRIRAEYEGQSAIFFETRLNPSGSRNLQP
jgi:hypothetical protein